MYQRLTPSVFQVGGPGFSVPEDCLCYLIQLGVPVLIDCGLGPGWSRIRENIEQILGKQAFVNSLILTHNHADHIGAAAKARECFGCTVTAHTLDADAIRTADPVRTAASWYGLSISPCPIDLEISGAEETLHFPNGELHLLHAPGHTPGSMVAWIDRDDSRILFGQDIHGPFHPDFNSDLNSWRESMSRLLDLEADILCEGHYGVYKGKSAVRQFIEEQLVAHSR